MMGRKMGRKLSFNSWMTVSSALALSSMLVWASASRAVSPAVSPGKTRAAQPTQLELEQQFARTVRPFIQTYCTDCHGADKPQAQLNLSAYGSMASVIRDYPHWHLVSERVAANQMPPAESGKQPTLNQKAAVVAWIQAVRQFEAQRNAGDPGPVLARRLSNAEYDYTIRDLTGQDLRLARSFPVDPANQEGFDNSGESLTVSPSLLKKYYQAAKDISDHMVLTTNGITFASHPVIGETDRDKFCTLRIVDFYHRQPTDYASYFEASWHYKHRAALGTPGATLEQIAANDKISPKYLRLVWRTLHLPAQTVGPIARLQEQWNALPPPAPGSPNVAKKGCTDLRDWVVKLRREVAWRFGNLQVPSEFSTGSQCNILWKDRQYASHRRFFNPAKLQIGGIPETQIVPARRREPEKTVTDKVDPELFVPQDAAVRVRYMEGFTAFSNVFPDAFYIDERGLMEGDNIYAKEGRLLSAGSHNAMGYFRDDTPLMQMILDEAGQKTLNALWRDFSTVAAYHERMHLQFFFYERNEARTILTERDPEFNFAKSEDKANLSDERIQRFSDLYVAKAERKGGQPETLAAFKEHFRIVSHDIRAAERDRTASEPVQRQALLIFAQKAFRHPLSSAERADIQSFYTMLRQKEGLSHDDAMRDTLTRILLSPSFFFRLDMESPAVPPEIVPKGNPLKRAAWTLNPVQTKTSVDSGKTEPLSDYALASRLSYFLWSSLPDDELLAHAAKGDLHRPDVLAAQTHRMLKNPKTRALATEFGGNWLDFRHFEEHNAVDKQRFPSFDDSLRQAMYEEPIHLMQDTFQNNGVVLDWIYGKYTFVNAPLAKHYGMDDVKPTGDAWVRVGNADTYGRGGLLPMGVFLTKNASGLRTSPVKRGYWVVRRVLGEQIPPPPAVVPDLPKDEEHMGDKTLREALKQHRENPACASCHARFDSYGLVFEGFGPIGQRRASDGGGKPIDCSAPFPGGKEATGVAGLQEFIRQRRQNDFVDTFARKMLSYSLSRTLLPSDDLLLASLKNHLSASGYRFNALIDTIVASPQFRSRRAQTAPTKDTTRYANRRR